MSRPRNIALALMAAASLAACSNGSSATGLPPGDGLPNNAPAGDKGAPVNPGVPAKSLSCDKFIPADVEAAAAKVVPTVKARAKPDSGSSSPSSDKISCMFDIYTPGTDLSSANLGMVTFLLVVSDSWTAALIDVTDKTAASEQKAFDSEKDSTKTAQGPGGQTSEVSDVTGVGKAAYLQDIVDKQSDDSLSQIGGRVSILRDLRPYKVEIQVTYVPPQPETVLPDKTLDTAMRDKSNRAQLQQAVAKALVDKVG
jgi:hypothetical protein